ncbi:MAG: hypothetical protein J6S78_01570, partial [Lachnospiraceae bacterium]|nr:hypothetical protein [Lachnospiraceae bacterium]
VSVKETSARFVRKPSASVMSASESDEITFFVRKMLWRNPLLYDMMNGTTKACREPGFAGPAQSRKD